ncbi:MAG: phage portal protein [Oscillospiraceae bacterium]|nr:phage portal protein [Oscillospiraceae bacterium]
MLITETDLINLRISANATQTDAQILAELILAHETDPGRVKAIEADRYYKFEQDIKALDFQTVTVINSNDVEEEFTNKNRSNVRIQHRFLFNQVEQKIGYISGKEPTIAVDDAEPSEDGSTGNEEFQFQTALTNTTDAKFRKVLLQWQRKTSLHGVSWLHEYKDAKGKLRQVIIGRDSFIPIYDTSYEQDLLEGIYYYPIELRTGTETKIIIKAQWWTAKDVTYWVQSGNSYIMDPDYPINPAPHYWEVTRVTGPDGVTQVEKSRVPKTWGRIPFIEQANNADKLTDLEPIKDLIDSYDLVASKGTNNLMDFNEFYAVIQGFGGDTASAIVRKLEINRAVSVNSQGGNIEMKQLDLQMSGRIDWLKELWKAIHVFGQAVDVTNDQLGNAPSGVSLKFQYTLLDLKANNMIIEAETALKEHLTFLTEEINKAEKKQYDPEEIRVTFNKSPITNDAELVQMIIDSDNLVPERILLAAHPLIHDADQAYKDMMEQRKERIEDQRRTFGTVLREEGGEHEGEKE